MYHVYIHRYLVDRHVAVCFWCNVTTTETQWNKYFALCCFAHPKPTTSRGVQFLKVCSQGLRASMTHPQRLEVDGELSQPPPPCGTLDIPRWQWYRWLMECIPPVYSLVIGCNRSWPIDGWIPWPHGLDPRQGHTGEGFIDLSFRCIPTEVSKIFGTTPWKNMENEIPCHGLSSYSKPKPTI